MSMDRPQEQFDQRDHSERVEDEKDGAAAQEAELPATTATALPEGDGGPESTAGEQLTVPEDRDAGVSPTPPGRLSSADDDFQVFGSGELEGYGSRWESIQLGFLDDPKGAAEQADAVVGELLGRLTERREALADELNRRSDQNADTESLRVAVRNYRLPSRPWSGADRARATDPSAMPISRRRDPSRGSPASNANFAYGHGSTRHFPPGDKLTRLTRKHAGTRAD